MKFYAVLFLLLTASAPAARFDEESTRNTIIDMVNAGDTTQVVVQALNRIMKVATTEVINRNNRQLGYRIMDDWANIYRPEMLGELQDQGDHKPLNQWLADTYAQIESVLGPTLCDFLHISDINIINFSIPVVFHPHLAAVWCQEYLASDTEDHSCKNEYRRHFAGTKWQTGRDPDAHAREHYGLMPVCAYWIAEGACTAATQGSGFMFCSPIATGIEIAVARYIAPPASDKVWDKNNN